MFRPSAIQLLTRAQALRVLQLREGASVGEIKQAYFKLSQTYHPDHNQDGNTDMCAEMQKQINAAYERLG